MQKNGTPLIRLSHVSKQYGSFEAVTDVSFDISEGESVGIVGPNGAGKTTLLRMLCALVPVSSGLIEYCGQGVSYSEKRTTRGQNRVSNLLEFRRAIGFVPQTTTLDDKLTAQENLQLQARLYHMHTRETAAEFTRILNLVGLSDFASRPVETYSGGMKRRLELARALFHRPRILILDEPTLGLDPVARHEIWDYLHQMQQTEKTTLLITTNTMEEAERLCDHIVIINHGRLVTQGTPRELQQRLPGGLMILHVDLSDAKDVEVFLSQVQKSGIPQSSLQLLEFEQEDPGSFHCKVSSAEDAIRVLVPAIQSLGIKISALQCQSPTLDDVFLHFARPIDSVPFSQVAALRKIMETLGLSPREEA
ncbi:MAG: daunorubicin resistance ABC transporter ATPase subunit [Promethearchaeota archaeon CR_4]|nr:MAG: daunorubicin resistance ABC transporter ATPase subunit [Candidatus Lokiarchaeota archaeon CR_4]